MRLFICTLLRPDSQAFYRRLISEMADRCAGALRPVPKDSVHLTHAFLGNADASVLAEAVQAAEVVAARHRSIAVRLGPPRLLSARPDARLILADVVSGAAELIGLADDLRAELARRLPAISVRGGRTPHATLARFRRSQPRRAAALADAALRVYAGAEREDMVTCLHVVSSELSSEGARYDVKAALPLRRET